MVGSPRPLAARIQDSLFLKTWILDYYLGNDERNPQGAIENPERVSWRTVRKSNV